MHQQWCCFAAPPAVELEEVATGTAVTVAEPRAVVETPGEPAVAVEATPAPVIPVPEATAPVGVFTPTAAPPKTDPEPLSVDEEELENVEVIVTTPEDFIVAIRSGMRANLW